MKLPRIRRRSWTLWLAMPIIAAIVHLFTTMLAVSDTRASAFTRLTGILKLNQMTPLDAVSPGHQPLPYLSSDARYAMCLFNTHTGLVRVRAVLPDVGWTLGVYRPDGSSAYFAAAQPGRGTTISLTIAPDDTRFLGLTPQALGQSVDTSPSLTVAAREGVIVVRAPDTGASTAAAAIEGLTKATCQTATY